jgi:hypothetical protein
MCFLWKQAARLWKYKRERERGLRAYLRRPLMTKWFLLVLVLGTTTIVDRSLAAEISKDQLATAWAGQPTCNPWVDYD